MNDTELIDEITLTMVDGVGSLTFQRLYDYFGDCSAILSASAHDLQAVSGINPKVANKIATARETCSVAGLLELCRRERIDIISRRDAKYPKLLKSIHDPPQILYVIGEIKACDELAIAVVGTRQVTPYGKHATYQLTRGLALKGITIVSGLAKGIDTISHLAALEAGGRTIAVLGGGLLKLFPKENAVLAEKIAQSGAVISEYHPLMEPNKGTFPQRNRIVAGLSHGILITEAPKKSGAMITARMAVEQGRELFAVPGNIDSYTSQGCNQLIRDGAILVESVDDILESLGPLLEPVKHPLFANELRHPGELQLNEIEEQVLHAVETALTPLERIVKKSGLMQHQVLAALMVLEEHTLIRRTENNQFVRF